MPVFFVLTGFFSALLLQRRGITSFIRNRCQRVLYPFIVFFCLMNVIRVTTLFLVTPHELDQIPGPTLFGIPLLALGLTAHLWFLYLLLYFYSGTWLLTRLIGSSQFPHPTISKVLVSPLALAGWVGLLALVLYGMPVATFFADGDLLLNWRIMLGYGLFYSFGWLLYQAQAIRQLWQRWAWPFLFAGVLIFIGYQSLLPPITDGPNVAPSRQAQLSVLSAASSWLLGISFIGLFDRYVNQTHPTWQYFADASYWVYLIHVPICVWIQTLLIPVEAPALVKFGVVLLVTAFVSLLSYDLLVRGTAIGRWLNGRSELPLWRQWFSAPVRVR
ncbi:acyltransferase family protein [Spirosoma taeanense]|uniref:Acyltransferase family protein n=2 Tax=Spirosoma taeanense TaxID=2735870 RepID=A0A6M5Y9Q1_9BACT|nr:acyltransferase family protein [Spirosoma taeanense]